MSQIPVVTSHVSLKFDGERRKMTGKGAKCHEFMLLLLVPIEVLSEIKVWKSFSCLYCVIQQCFFLTASFHFMLILTMKRV